MNTLVRLHDIQMHGVINQFVNALNDAQLTHYASDLLPELELANEISFMESITRAQQVMATLNLPIEGHFKRIYRTTEGCIYCDYKLSHVAYLLVSINGDVANKKVASIQYELIKRLIGAK